VRDRLVLADGRSEDDALLAYSTARPSAAGDADRLDAVITRSD